MLLCLSSIFNNSNSSANPIRHFLCLNLRSGCSWTHYHLTALMHLQADDPSVDRVRNSLQAAFQAVGAGDILDTDFANLEKSLGHRLDSIDVTSQKSSQEGSQQTMEPGRSTDGPPELSKGDDDIFWMSQLHGALLQVLVASCTEFSRRTSE